ncbi:hypothetical protein CAEBREN_04095 [Caenorhabditis brenneri]|uniref:Uncharacterized protein n=1 Tax=Caenorhabditis brenneri TaxID=135651 RepID=G0NGG8_CAEBE|nr:hypothetical protein CAEBREN_04095 [Caenorhabditis brenneri]
MPNLLQTDERAYRICILYEALRKKPVEKAYKHMKEVLQKSKTLEWCSLGIESAEEEDPDFDEDLVALDENIVEIMLEDPSYSDSRYNVEGADYYFEITCDRWNDTVCLDVSKKPISG